MCAQMARLDEQDWDRLIESLNRGNCVLVCGPDIPGPTESDDHEQVQGSSLTSMLAKQIAASLPPDMQPASYDDLAHVAQLRYKKDGDRSDLEIEVKRFYKPLDGMTSVFYRDLAQLPFTLYLTTIPAHFLANAFPGDKAPQIDYYHFRKTRPVTILEAHRPIVYHLYGDLTAVDSLVLTETELLEFLVNIVKATPALPPVIQAQLADSQTSFLFLGFGFQRWYTRVLLHALQTYNRRNRSMAVEAATFFEHPDSRRTSLFFEKEHKIEFRQHSWAEFAAELHRRYHAQRPITPQPALPTDAPKVFLCYDRRDRDRVKEVESRLYAKGIGTWRDQQDLRGGDDWDRRIEQVLEKQIDYVLVLQTPNMLERAESYIHKEITVALARQDRFDQGIRFVIPAMLHGRAGLERLSRLQFIDLTERDGVERLAKEILEDWHKRRRRSTANQE